MVRVKAVTDSYIKDFNKLIKKERKEIMEKLTELLIQLRPGVDFEKEEDLVSAGVMDSITIVELITVLEENFGVEITMEEFVPENFKSVRTIQEMIDRLK